MTRDSLYIILSRNIFQLLSNVFHYCCKAKQNCASYHIRGNTGRVFKAENGFLFDAHFGTPFHNGANIRSTLFQYTE